MSIKVGDKIPSSQFGLMTESGPGSISSEELFGGKRVAIFSVPGAFTPTCSAKHLPGFVQQASALRAKGIDTIACYAVNDVFVMSAWGKDQKAGGKVLMLADGNGTFTKSIGLELDGSSFGMGLRSQRFSMVVDDGIVEHLFVEAPGAFEVSSAEYMLANI
jgi:peroxiredoxin